MRLRVRWAMQCPCRSVDEGGAAPPLPGGQGGETAHTSVRVTASENLLFFFGRCFLSEYVIDVFFV